MQVFTRTARISALFTILLLFVTAINASLFRRAPAGSACTTSTQCDSGSCNTRGQCDLACAVDSDCAELGQTCSATTQVCEPLQYNDPCDPTLMKQCATQRCLFRRPVPLTPEPPQYLCSYLDGGSACFADSDCGSRSCVGGTCALSAGDAPCVSNFDCVSGVCDVNNAKCKLGPGDPCGGSYGCMTDQCTNGVCGPALRGMACTQNSQCLSNNCEARTDVLDCREGFAQSVCLPTKRCGTGVNGASCRLPTDCDSNFCDFATNTCKPYSPFTANPSAFALGAACRKNTDCASLRCSMGGFGYVCMPQFSGQACTDSAMCASTKCDAATQTCAISKTGEPCGDPLDCVSGACRTVCLASPGEACTNDNQCGSYQCYQGKCVAYTSSSQHLCSKSSDCLSGHCIRDLTYRDPSGRRQGEVFPGSFCATSNDGETCQTKSDCYRQNCRDFDLFRVRHSNCDIFDLQLCVVDDHNNDNEHLNFFCNVIVLHEPQHGHVEHHHFFHDDDYLQIHFYFERDIYAQPDFDCKLNFILDFKVICVFDRLADHVDLDLEVLLHDEQVELICDFEHSVYDQDQFNNNYFQQADLILYDDLDKVKHRLVNVHGFDFGHYHQGLEHDEQGFQHNQQELDLDLDLDQHEIGLHHLVKAECDQHVDDE
ncbi:hypothetical protein OC842_002956 [Tilletia horrida]|uniref:Dickkopf N-terminal cysteine-rich domain-containing protein n=1 Tax=Tilletia horrida TaxID=155126 RepID=A0AAN6GCC0_9BASI|nr:hypothetical protein OC842_002956 [Tilletia horrida]